MEEILNENSDQVKTSADQVKEWASIVRTNVIQWQETGETLIENLEFDG